MLSKSEIQSLYRKMAGAYDVSANLYYLIGFREARYRQRAIAQLNLKPGDTVVEIGCGTGLNFSYVLDKVGSSGKLIGVDLTDQMLERAKARVADNQWGNIKLIECDAAAYEIPDGCNAVYSTFSLTLVPEFERVIERASKALAPGGRLVILDFKQPDRWPLWLIKFGVWITSPFGVSLDLAERKPWQAMQKYFSSVMVEQLYGGFSYIAVGEKHHN